MIGAPNVERLQAEVEEIAALYERMHRFMNTILTISGTLDLSAVLHHIVDDARALVDARYGALGVLNARQEMTQLITAGVDPEVHARVGRLPRGRGLLGEMMRHAHPIRVDDVDQDPHAAGFPRGHPPMHNLLGVPIRTRGTLHGDLYLADKRSGEPFTQEDEDIVTGLAAAAAVAIENARLYQDLRSATERFQRSLLARRIEMDPLRLQVRYQPATETPSVGGDWYDMIPLPDGARLVVGDVMGHDLQAAVAMSKISNMLRVIALDDGASPSVVLHEVDRALQRLHEEPLATILLAQVEQRAEWDWRLRWASAGHLPPLLITPGGEASYLPTDSGPPIGVDVNLPRADHGHIIAPGSTVLMFTDGLVEKRGTSLARGMDDVARTAERLHGRTEAEICDGLLEHHGGTAEDDIALLCLSVPYLRSPATA
ncbi:SpoIIE family protein phosphatase [Nonomuraea sp. K274]|uniref:SpoIIE family protein phosphatase n=1 Tax=Nonomuraea cypriaca TaxID=1187855 RepID=A0A931AA53_9ACTN|nr:GAF domain-containing SpoIIE family protein phosphatase [Nonomuraea cypriaca]MBF8189061.1 SpoIIE family protein phosphatase [Nonomuraea cypriaca]